jgi:hypothetical protein
MRRTFGKRKIKRDLNGAIGKDPGLVEGLDGACFSGLSLGTDPDDLPGQAAALEQPDDEP